MESIPGQQVLYTHIYPSLEYRDLLRLRRVSKVNKSNSDDYLRAHFQNKVREVETSAALQMFLEANLPTTSISIGDTVDFFTHADIAQFLNLCGDKITHLKIKRLDLSDLHYLSSLPNLQHLEIEHFHASETGNGQVPMENPPFPANFRNLKTLKLELLYESKYGDYGVVWTWLEFCESLEYFKQPNVFDYVSDTHPDISFGYVIDHIRRRSLNNLQNLKYYDLQHGICSDNNVEQFCELVRVCYHNQVKLLNVPAFHLQSAAVLFATSPEIFTTPLVSMRNVRKAIFCAELPNLQKLEISTRLLSFSSASWTTAGERGPPQWLSLNSLDLTIDSSLLDTCYGYDYDDDAELYDSTDVLIQFLFGQGNIRKGMRELAIRFDDGDWDVNEFPIPNSLNVADSCSFLVKLTLDRWIGTNEQVWGFWEGLPLLEEVTLENCKKLGDAAFVGDAAVGDAAFVGGNENPVFLQLANLKKVELWDLDKMPGITDKSFEEVFSHLKIKRFYLTSKAPLVSVTKGGIEALLAGNFNRSVEKFPFDGWSLDGVPEEGITELKLKVRATHMI